MGPRLLKGLDERRLRLGLGLFFFALAIPTGILVEHTYRQLKWEAFHQNQVLAEELAGRIDTRLAELIGAEERRSFADYAFVAVAGDPAAGFLQRSPLSAYPVASEIPGLIGYFQVDSRGELSTPLLPPPGIDPGAYGVSASELAHRAALEGHITQILSENRLVRDRPAAGRARATDALDRPPQRAGGEGLGTERDLSALSSRGKTAPPLAEEAPALAQAAFDRLDEANAVAEKKQKAAQGSLGRVEDLKLEAGPQGRAAEELQRQLAPQRSAPLDKRGARRERSAVPEPAAPAAVPPGSPAPAPAAKPRIATFESAIDPFELSLLQGGQFVLYRKVWREGQRTIQGALIEQGPFLQGLVDTPFQDSGLSRLSRLILAFRGDVLATYAGGTERYSLPGTEGLRGALLYQTRLSDPLSGLQLIFSLTRLPVGSGTAVVGWAAGVLVLVLCGGFYLLYRLGLGQIRLARQQQDFVSAVSHELRTPLTAIRMYSEMLREGWVRDEKRRDYYRFIQEESERLSRLITNLLQLARLSRKEPHVELESIALGELMAGVSTKIASQAEQAGMSLALDCPEPLAAALVRVDRDYFAQILINLVDNAIKFSAKASQRRIDLSCRTEGQGLVVAVRDYGPGVARHQMMKIFRLFYRAESELTRETVGTGIGLALVRQMAQAMGGSVDLVNREPGAEFRLHLPMQRSG